MRRMMPAIAEVQGDMTQVAGDFIYPVLNMLNTRYIIMPLQGGKTVPLHNPYAYGNAWFVDNITYVDNANDEIAAIGAINLRHQAVADKRFQQALGSATQQQGASMVTLTGYEPNQINYQVQSATGGIVVFSEVYYPGWTATVDGESVPVGRVNYLLRAISVKPGTHNVVLTFKPVSVKHTETAAYISYLLLIVAIVVGVVMELRRRRNHSATNEISQQ